MISIGIWIISLVVLLADRKLIERLRGKLSPRVLRFVSRMLVANDLVLPAVWLLGRMFPDNTEPWVTCCMWVNLLWLLTIAPRMVYFVAAYFRHPRWGIALGAGIIVLFGWGATLGRTTFHITEEEFLSERLPAGFDGLRIVHVTDLHIGTLVHPEAELSRLVAKINALRPDLVIATGDLVTIRYTELNPARQAILSRISAPMGIYSITGNHDVGAYIRDTVALPRDTNTLRLIAREEAMGWHVLDNTTTYLKRNGDSISLSGASYDVAQRKQRHDRDLPALHLDEVYRGVDSALYNITAVHVPQWWDAITARGYGDLTLAGHVHAMQCKINLFGWHISPARLLYTRWSGRYDQGAKSLYISDGTGYVGYPVRLGAYPEITLITLRKK